ncbi:MAG: RNA polymerase sigma factor [Marinilabiliaceae bacterium]|nr:RNA polymerase sigma factor [Marinilabiliaceae bacterium]
MTDDQLIIKRIRKGNVDAFRQLVEKHHKRVVYICLSLVHQAEDAEDVAQEVFIEVFKSIESYRGDAAVSTWLYRLSVNKSLDFIRSMNRQKRGKGLITNFEKEELERQSIEHTPIPSDQMEAEERRNILRWGIDQLPERQKVAITLSKLDEMSQQEVAQAMGTSVSSVESLLVRGKKRLKEVLAKCFEEIF